MKKLLALAILSVLTFGFGGIASAVESARSNSPLSKVEPVMQKEEAPAEKTEALVSEEAAMPTDESAIVPEQAADDLLAPIKEDEAPATPSDNE